MSSTKEPVLVIMAAGMGSRYGGLKQIDPVDEQGNIIIDFSIYDAVKAGFKTIVFIIKHQIEEEFKRSIGDRIGKYVNVKYVYQELDKLPQGYSVPEGRVKPFGTGHAILCAKDTIDGPFAVINADDYYGRHAFETIYNFLTNSEDDDKYRYAMVGYKLHNTLTENGHVARGVCEVDDNGNLVSITERTRIEKHGEDAEYTTDDGATWKKLDKETLVSMNMWGFSNSLMGELENRFVDFLNNELPKNTEKAEYFLPFVVDDLLKENKATAKVLPTPDVWHGVTYKEDKPQVMAAIKELKEQGMYPDVLWA
ncbi:MAG: nucleotidyltransferase [Lachnospiraceae bacterium]|nr:nucleotidyltransferase [Candidatus Colinaster equi]